MTSSEKALQCLNMYKMMNDNYNKAMSKHSQELYTIKKEKAKIDNELEDLRKRLSDAQKPENFPRKLPSTCIVWGFGAKAGPVTCRNEFGNNARYIGSWTKDNCPWSQDKYHCGVPDEGKISMLNNQINQKTYLSTSLGNEINAKIAGAPKREPVNCNVCVNNTTCIESDCSNIAQSCVQSIITKEKEEKAETEAKKKASNEAILKKASEKAKKAENDKKIAEEQRKQREKDLEEAKKRNDDAGKKRIQEELEKSKKIEDEKKQKALEEKKKEESLKEEKKKEEDKQPSTQTQQPQESQNIFKNKKMLFIIGGIILGVVLLIIIVLIIPKKNKSYYADFGKFDANTNVNNIVS